ncbi:MAG: aminotransferase class I/II-fold pyridoxal phosphate-dependent enzyme [Candidatus Latescibacteria bacterium]|nr:aminotransferase class I/II-fold pyridoxal phosphate-dependent enzyme [Candidatus Latescibacterota bacterium]
MTRLAVEHGAVNLSQGFTDEAPPYALVWGALAAILGGTDEGIAALEGSTMGQIAAAVGAEDFAALPLQEALAWLQRGEDRFNQYSYPFGLPELRHAIAAYTQRFQGFRPDPDDEITVVLGATEGLSSLLRAVFSPGDALIVFQPFHEMYPSQAELFGLEVRYVNLRQTGPEGAWEMDRDEVRRAAGAGARAIVLNSPHNPTGKVFSVDELDFIAQLCQEYDLLAVTDEIYEHILYDGHRHFSLAARPEMRSRTLVVNSISKTGNATGWRIGWVISPPAYTGRIRSVHDTLVVQAPTPLQKGAQQLLGQDDGLFTDLRSRYAAKRRTLLAALRQVGFEVTPPQGSYYLFADYRGVAPLRQLEPMAASQYLIEKVGVAPVPGDNFYRVGDGGRRYLRFAFCRSLASLQEAGRRLQQLGQV